MERKLRDACDSCHIKKVKCASNGTGACSNCRLNSTTCTYSPRDQMGRPIKTNTKDSRKKRPSAKPVQMSMTQTSCDGGEWSDESSVPSQSLGSSIEGASSVQSSTCPDQSFFDRIDFDTELPDFAPLQNTFSNSSFFNYGQNQLPSDLGMSLASMNHLARDDLLIDPSESPFNKGDAKPGHVALPLPASIVAHSSKAWSQESQHSRMYEAMQISQSQSRSPEHQTLDPSISANGRAAALYTLLCRVAFSLRSQGGHSWRTDNASQLQDSKELFDLVSKFCNITLNDVLTQCGRLSVPDDPAVLNVVMLITTNICLIINAYSARLESFLHLFNIKSPSAERNQTELQSRRSSSMEGSTLQLESLIQLTVMDYHTSQLGAMLNHLNKNESLQPLMKSAGDCMVDLEHLHAQIKHASAGVKSAESDITFR